MEQTRIPQNDWKKLVKRELKTNDLFLITANLVPLLGVLFWQWNGKEMFLVYCLETVIVGAYTVIQMLVAIFFSDRRVSGKPASGVGLVLFFIFHYGFFVFVQLSLFLSVLNYPGLREAGSAFKFLFHFPRYLGNNAMIVLLIFIFSYGVMMTRKFIWTGLYKNANVAVLMFSPYPRIFVQQFVVILGSFVLMFGDASRIFMIIFVIVKLFFELVFDYDRLMNEVQKQELIKSSENS